MQIPLACGDLRDPDKRQRFKSDSYTTYVLAMNDKDAFLMHGVEWFTLGKDGDHEQADDSQYSDSALDNISPESLCKRERKRKAV